MKEKNINENTTKRENTEQQGTKEETNTEQHTFVSKRVYAFYFVYFLLLLLILLLKGCIIEFLICTCLIILSVYAENRK